MTDNSPELLKPSEVCRRLAIGNDLMHKLIKEGKLRATKLGPNSTRVHADSVAELIAKGVEDA